VKDVILILPEIFLALTLAFVIAGEISYHGEQFRLISITALLGLGGAFIQTIMTYQAGPARVFSGVLSVDGLALFFKLIFIGLAALTVFGAGQSKEIPRNRRTEYVSLILASCLAMCLVASAADLMLAFLALQFLNILSFLLTGYGKRSARSTEAAVKYMAFAAVAAAFLLYSIAMLFAVTHSLNLYDMHKILTTTPLTRTMMLVVMALTILSLTFQVGAFPMYLWTPDVVEGAPTPVSGFVSMGTRAAGFAFAIRFFIVVFAQPGEAEGQWKALGEIDWTQMLSTVAALSMAFGALLAIRQTAAKRLVGSLIVADTGFLLLGLLVLDQVGVAAMLYTWVIELFCLVGVFTVLAFLEDELRSDRLVDMKGALRRAVPESICLLLFLFCLVGVPPLPGFISKFTLIGAAVRHHRPALAIVGIASMALSTVAVARLAFALVGDFRNASYVPIPRDTRRRAFLAVLLFPMLLAGVFADAVFSLAGRSLGFILW